jgi:large subunit ribosomal protein L13
MTRTYSTKASEIKRDWHLVDLEGKILGRTATRIAAFLIGKNKPYFAPYLDCGDFVVAINADQVKLTGRKRKQKKYYRHSGYPGGFKEIPLDKQMEKDSRKIIWQAVSGMLPKNKLRKKRLGRLKIFKGEKHPYQNKIKA